MSYHFMNINAGCRVRQCTLKIKCLTCQFQKANLSQLSSKSVAFFFWLYQVVWLHLQQPNCWLKTMHACCIDKYQALCWHGCPVLSSSAAWNGMSLVSLQFSGSSDHVIMPLMIVKRSIINVAHPITKPTITDLKKKVIF